MHLQKSFSHENKYLECQVVKSFFFLFFSPAEDGAGLVALRGMQILGALWGIDLIGAVIRLVKSGVRSSFPPERQGGKERRLGASGV